MSMPLHVSSNTMHECDRNEMLPVVTFAPLPVVIHNVSLGLLRTRENSPLLIAVLHTSPWTGHRATLRQGEDGGVDGGGGCWML